MRESLAEIYSTVLRRGGDGGCGGEAICFPRMTTRKRENDGYHVTQRVTKQTSSVDGLVQ
jgi:hypothetical protein